MQLLLDVHDELIVDNFAGGGGASTGIEMALGRRVDIAINHDRDAVSMHSVNHPETRHYCENVWAVDPRKVADGRPVGLLWLSPDCKHFSKAKGGKPVEKGIRALAWLAVRWAKAVQPRVIMLENVEEFLTWGPLVNGKPCPKGKGKTFAKFCNKLRKYGYEVEFQMLRACDYGAPTIRKRLFLIARRDGEPIVWPEPTHGDPKSEAVKKGKLLPWRTAAECIDWTIPCPSIFERKRPLAENTLRRIAKGVMRYVVNAQEPFIVPYYGPKSPNEDRSKGLGQPLPTQTTENRFGLVTPFVAPVTHHGSDRVNNIQDPLRTVTTAKRGEFALISPVVVNTANSKTTGRGPNVWSPESPLRTITASPGFALVSPHLSRQFGNSIGHGADDPVGTVTAGGGGKTALVAAFLAKHYTGVVGAPVDVPTPTVTAKDHNALVASNIVKLRGTCRDGQPVDEPLHTVSAGGTHFAEVRAFLIKYYGTDQDPRLTEPMHTSTTKDRFGLVTVAGEEYAITDIGMRMLQPRELYRAQGFPDAYIIGDDPEQGLTLTKTAQVRLCGNSVSPPVAAALVKANVPDMAFVGVA